MKHAGGSVTQLEKDIQADIVKLLETVGAAVYRIGTTRKKGDHQGTMQTPGIPDLCAFVPVPYSTEYGNPNRHDAQEGRPSWHDADAWDSRPVRVCSGSSMGRWCRWRLLQT